MEHKHLFCSPYSLRSIPNYWSCLVGEMVTRSRWNGATGWNAGTAAPLTVPTTLLIYQFFFSLFFYIYTISIHISIYISLSVAIYIRPDRRL